MRRRGSRSLQVLAAGLALAIPTSGKTSDQPGPRCAATSAVGPCFLVHGRLVEANGTPGLRILVVGTKRILGVHNDDVEPGQPAGYPKCLLPHFGPGKDLSADFTVCPVAPDREGRMRPVCIESASNMVVSERQSATQDQQRVQRIAGVCADP